MSTILTGPTKIRGLDPGTVVMAREIKAPARQVWQALTDPPVVSQWLGTLTTPLAEGQNTRLDFGDGDFFTLQDVVLNRPDHLRYSWRFLGIGPLDTIDWYIIPKGAGCRVTVTADPGAAVPASVTLAPYAAVAGPVTATGGVIVTGTEYGTSAEPVASVPLSVTV